MSRKRTNAEVLAIAEEVSSHLRHDLRNKLSSVRNAVFYIERSLKRTNLLEEDERLKRFLTLISEQLGEADALLDQRATYGHLVAPSRRRMRVEQLIAAALDGYDAPEAVQIEVEVEGTPEVEGDPDELVLALRSVLDNAFDAVENSGKIAIRVRAAQEVVQIAIEDSGLGMSAEQRAGALTPFTSHKPGHAGLGLNVAQRIVTRLGGTIELGAGGSGRGTTVTLCVPSA